MANIPRRYLWVAAGTVAAFGVMYLRDRFGPGPGQDNDKDGDKDDGRRRNSGQDETAANDDTPAEGGKTVDSDDAAEPDEPSPKKELRAFLAGDAWFDEAGWRGLWEREAIDDPKVWLTGLGIEVLKEQRALLKDHPALLAGCRRRFIVVARYAGIDVSDAAKLWTATDA